MAVDVNTIQSINIFSDLDNAELEAVSQITDPMKVSEGEILASRGRYANTFYVVLSGNFMIGFKSGKAVTVHQKGDIMGWSTVVTPFKYRGTVVALTDGEVLTISGDEFLRLLQSNSSLGDKLMEKIRPVAVERASLDDDHLEAGSF